MNDKYLAGSEPERRKFDLEAAKRGEPLVTRDGRSAKFVAHVPEAKKYNVVVFIEGGGGVDMLTGNGRFYADSCEDSEHDLFMAPKPKRTVWVNFYGEDNRALWYPAENLAEFHADRNRAVAVAVPVQIDVW